MDFELFKTQFIRSMQDSGIDENKLKEFRKILDTPTGELIVRAAFYTAKKS
jgi:hypothetical protein